MIKIKIVQVKETQGEILQEKETTTSINRLLETAFYNELAIAAWKEPGRDSMHVVLDISENYKVPLDPELESLDQGFLVSPFLNESNHLSYLIRADIHYVGENRDKLRKYPAPEDRNEEENEGIYHGLNLGSRSGGLKYHINSNCNLNNSEQEEFRDLVRLAVQRIRAGDFQKVVPSRREMVDLRENFEIADAFIELTRQFPDSFVSFFSIPGKGTWMGASPEILIEVNESGIFRTSAVAGTQLLQPGTELSTVAWTQKEIEEQALVSRYIINNFKKIRLREFEEFGPKTVLAGNLVHLRTDFTVNIHDVNFPQLGSVMLKLLHPTSAVCGMPKDASADFLRIHENYDREFYSGFLGPVNMGNRTSLYVNLRCTQLLDGKAILYSGAGITLDSDPEKEWKETLIKIQTMKEILAGTPGPLSAEQAGSQEGN
jgi:isochorismate synthase